MEEAVARLRAEFGQRLLFVGLQGSYRRGEAREDSDIDILTVLDKVELPDLAAYRRVLRALPEGGKACGFTCGREELRAWPPLEIFQFSRDVRAYYGELAPLLPPVTRADAVNGARIGLAAIYHLTAHRYVSGEAGARPACLEDLYKSCFFSLQLLHYLRGGDYAASKRELLTLLTGDEAEILRLSLDPDHYARRSAEEPEALFRLLLEWSGRALRELEHI